jgi:hypothetical protein
VAEAQQLGQKLQLRIPLNVAMLIIKSADFRGPSNCDARLRMAILAGLTR